MSKNLPAHDERPATKADIQDVRRMLALHSLVCALAGCSVLVVLIAR